MRLTLRTLLAYLDDTLEPNEIKEIGLKVAESDAAQELVARIKQVTRRRRLTTPPPGGPNAKFDANTIAEYLDNELSSELVAELEKTCLESDVHLAEVASCHQILTLVLGEPALVPPTARERMYGLVKGREAIPFRKAARPRRRRRGRPRRRRPAAAGPGVVARLAPLGLAPGRLARSRRPRRRHLAGAARRPSGRRRLRQPQPAARRHRQGAARPAGRGAAQGQYADPARRYADEPAHESAADEPAAHESAARDGPPRGRAAQAAEQGPSRRRRLRGPAAERVERPRPATVRPAGLEAAGSRQERGLQHRRPGQPARLQQRAGPRHRPRRPPALARPRAPVHRPPHHGLSDGKRRASVPAGSRLRRRPDAGPRPHLPVQSQDKRRRQGRLRFAGEVWALTLLHPDTEVGVDLIQAYLGDVNYLDEAPFRGVDLFVFSGRAGVKFESREYANLPPRADIQWDNKGPGATEPRPVAAQDWPLVQTVWSKTPPDGANQAERDAIALIREALDILSTRMMETKVEEALLEARATPDKPMERALAVYSFGAIGAVDRVLDVLCTDENEAHAFDRSAAVVTLRRWIGRDQANGPLLYNEQKGTGLLVGGQHLHDLDANTVFVLLHDFPSKLTSVSRRRSTS